MENLNNVNTSNKDHPNYVRCVLSAVFNYEGIEAGREVVNLFFDDTLLSIMNEKSQL